MDRLRSGLQHPVTLVAAGPGYGKTALLARFLQDSGEPSVWYSLDRSDRDPAVFFRYLVEGMARHVPGFGRRSEDLREDLRFRPEDAERLADVFADDAATSPGRRIVVVLDGVQHLEGSELCARALRRLVDRQPRGMHLILSGRSLPVLGSVASSPERGATRIEGDELLFTREETGTLLRDTFGLPARQATVERLHAR